MYDYHPVPDALTEKESVYIKGVQANLWTEYLTSVNEYDFSLYPRMAALSEVAWTEREKKNFKEFYSRLDNIKQHYDYMGINYCKDIYIKKE